MNKLWLSGRLTRDPEVRYSQGASQTAVARFSLAVNRKYKKEGEPEADFFNCTAFGKIAEFAEKYLRQGIKVDLVGRIQNDNYTNKNGEKVYSVQVLIEEIEFAESKKAAGDGVSGNKPMSSGDGFMTLPEGEEDNLPFN